MRFTKKKLQLALGNMGGATDPNLVPSLHFPFSTSGGLTSQQGYVLGLTRATAAWTTDHEGLIKACLSGEMRKQGFRRVYNRVSASENFSAAGWAKINAGTGTAPTTTAGATDPLGGTSAYRLQADIAAGSGAGDYSMIRQTSIGASTNTNVRRVWIKSNTGSSQVVLLDYNNTSVVTVTTSWQLFSITTTNNGQHFDIGTKGTGGTKTLDVLIYQAQYEDVTGQAITAPSEYRSVGVLSTPFHGYGVDGVCYYETTNGNTVSSNVVTEAAGTLIPLYNSSSAPYGRQGMLVEEAATNLCLQSETFDNASWVLTNITVGANAVVAPSGATTADSITGSAATSTIDQLFSAGASTVYTLTFWGKFNTGTAGSVQFTDNTANAFQATINWQTGVITAGANIGGATISSVESTAFPNGWYRYRMTGTTHGAAVTYRFRIVIGNTAVTYLWGAQLEQKAFSTSYIATTTATVTRNADVPSMATGAWFNATEGAVVCNFIPTAQVTAAFSVMSLNNATTNERIEMTPASSQGGAYIVDGGATQMSKNALGAIAVNVFQKLALAYKLNDSNAALNGTASTDDTGCTMPTPTQLQVGTDVSARYLNGCIASLTVYRSRLPNGILQRLSA